MSLEQRCKQLLIDENIDLDSEIDFDVNGTIHTLSFKYIIETFMLSSPESKEVFFIALQKALNTKETKIEQFFESMGQLLLMTHLSKKI